MKKRVYVPTLDLYALDKRTLNRRQESNKVFKGQKQDSRES